MLRNLPVEVQWSLLSIFGVLVVATGIVVILRRSKPGVDFSELSQRTRSWWMMAGVFVLAMALSKTVSVVFLGFISYLAFKEYISLIPTRRADRRVLFWAYICIPLSYYWVGIEWYGMFIIFIPVYAFLMLPMRMLIRGVTEGFLKAIGTLHWGLMTTVYCIGHAAALLMLENPEAGLVNSGPGLLFTLVVLTQGNDVAQYVWGKLLGRRKIIPSISPGKTWAGFIGGVLTTIGLSLSISPILTPMSLLHAGIVGFIIAVAGFMGDVTVSALKRDLGVKDSGSLLPGHGGILDRIDSLTYTAPFFFHFVRYFYF